MEQKNLAATLRMELKKGPTKQLRKAGKIPAVIYGHGEPISIAVDAKEFNQSFTDIQANILFDLDVEGDHRDVLVKEIQDDLLSDSIKHVDFFEIERGKTLRTTVPVHVEGTAAGVKEGGLLEELTHSLEIECMPKDIPSNITVDVSNLNVNESIHVSDLIAPEGVKILSPDDLTIVSVIILKTVEEETTTDEDEDEEATEETEETEE